MLKPTVEVREESGVLVAEFWDCLRLDPAPVQDLRKRYEEHLKRSGRPGLVVDLNGVTFAGSAALGGFLAIQRLNRPYGGRLIFCHVDPNVFEVFRVSKLDPLFTFVKDKAEALALLAPTESDGPPDQPSPAVTGSVPQKSQDEPAQRTRGKTR